MLPKGSIHADRVWKRFRADRQRNKLRDEVQRLHARLRGDVGKGWRWALRDVDILIEPGDAVGLVGSNGSGKTTLLKLLSRSMYPYAGNVKISGRVGALIEVNAGIHPDLSGRENVFVMGSLLGLSRKEVTRRFDEIVSFAGLQDAIDRQVKFYSSGMKMRLGFSVAAFLEPDVLLVDEVLAVGDAKFQQKCLDRMRYLLSQGTTVALVSHDLASVEATCTRGVWLSDGVVQADGPIRDVVGQYRRSVEKVAESNAQLNGVLHLVKTELNFMNGSTAHSQEPLEVTTVIEAPSPQSGRLFVGISEGTATPIFVVGRDLHFETGQTTTRCLIDRLPLPKGNFYLWIGVFNGKGGDLLPWHPAASLTVDGPKLEPPPRAIVRLSPVHVGASWETNGR